MMAKITEIDYRVRFGFDSGEIPLSIIKLTSGPEVFDVEHCNEEHGWEPAPDLISCWIGKPDGGYHEPPDGEPAAPELITKWLNKWKRGWESSRGS